MIIYHGSNKIIKKPVFGAGNLHNDYGQGFYCTESMDLAYEWGCSYETNGYANKYKLDTKGLKILDLTDPKYNVLNWLAILLENRVFRLNSDIAELGYRYIVENFGIEYKDSDIIIGYRADDSYFSFANAFLNNTISIEKLSEAMRYGMLGEQIVLMSKDAFDRVCFIEAIEANNEIYYSKKMFRDTKAREDFKKLKSTSPLEGNFLNTIITNKWGNDDVRLR